MSTSYNQLTALLAISKASFRAIFRQPSAIFFSILFPIIFILIFSSFGSGGFTRHIIAIEPGTDINNAVYDSMVKSPFIKILDYTGKNGVVDTARMNKELNRGQLETIVGIHVTKDSAGQDHYRIDVKSTTAAGNNLPLLLQFFENLTLKMERNYKGNSMNHFAVIPEVKEVRKYRSIDFILPGQLGFSVLFSTLFGIAFTFFNMREQLVLKRFYASPVNRINILLGIGMSRLFFQLLNVVILIGFGYFFLHFTLIHGFLTFLEMILMTIYMLFLLMGVGLIFSSIVKTDTSIPLLINLFGFPQMLLSGTFFSVDVFPKWMQPFCKALPLTQFNDAIRKISFEGVHIPGCWRQIGIMGIWIVVIYVILVRVLKWE